MLEKYSKSKTFMYIRKKKARRSRKKAAAENGDAQQMFDEDGEGEEDGDAGRHADEYADHAFRFEEFESVCISLFSL
jgi:replication fork protection complex subunit Tof1/Swi1